VNGYMELKPRKTGETANRSGSFKKGRKGQKNPSERRVDYLKIKQASNRERLAFRPRGECIWSDKQKGRRKAPTSARSEGKKRTSRGKKGKT